MQEDGREIAVLYRQYDGYPDVHGQEIFDILGKSEVVNGYNGGAQINGAGDMCVQLIAELKRLCVQSPKGGPTSLNQPGNFYLHAPGTRDCGEEYTYTLNCAKGDILVTVDGYTKCLFEGTMAEYGEWLKRYSDEEE